jgi:hypothetical protein
MAPDHRLAVIILTNRSAMSLSKTAAAALEMLLPFDSSAVTSEPSYAALSESEMIELAGSYTNHRQTIELVFSEGRLMASRRGGDDTESGGVARVVEKMDGTRIALRSGGSGNEMKTPGTSYYVVRAADGKPEYLISSGRALRRISTQDAKAQ